MISLLLWNIRSMKSQSAFARLKTLKNQYKRCFIGLQEPFVKAVYQGWYMRQLGMNGCHSNISNKIWIFWSFDLDVTIVEDTEQHLITCKVVMPDSNVIHISTIYAKCLYYLCQVQRHFKKRSMESTSSSLLDIKGPWTAVGDFNVIASVDECHDSIS